MEEPSPNNARLPLLKSKTYLLPVRQGRLCRVPAHFGILERIRDTNLTLISVVSREEKPCGGEQSGDYIMVCND